MKHRSGFLDLDVEASRREAMGSPVEFRVRGKTYALPVELPLDTVDLLLSDELGLVDFAKQVLASDEKDTSMAIVNVFLSRGNMPRDMLNAIYSVMLSLLGDEQYKEWRDGRPGLLELAKIIGHLFRAYGVSLGEAFVSLTSSVDVGATSSQISPDSITASTQDTSGEAQAEGSSVSVA